MIGIMLMIERPLEKPQGLRKNKLLRGPEQQLEPFGDTNLGHAWNGCGTAQRPSVYRPIRFRLIPKRNPAVLHWTNGLIQIENESLILKPKGRIRQLFIVEFNL